MTCHYSNIIIGGGPAGLNLALEFKKRGIDYLLLEASPAVGGQWDKLPVCGQLISLNKKFVPGKDHTYRMRYDWHTLSTISAEDIQKDAMLRFTEWTFRRTQCSDLPSGHQSTGPRPKRIKNISNMLLIIWG